MSRTLVSTSVSFSIGNVFWGHLANAIFVHRENDHYYVCVCECMCVCMCVLVYFLEHQ